MTRAIRFVFFSLLMILPLGQLRAHEVTPNIVDLKLHDEAVDISMRLNVEAFLAEIDLSQITNTDEAEAAGSYVVLRQLSADELTARLIEKWPAFSDKILLDGSEGNGLTLMFEGLDVPEIERLDVPRLSTISMRAVLNAPLASTHVTFDASFGATVLRQVGVAEGLTQYLDAGQKSDLILATGNTPASGFERFVEYVPVGFAHVVPDGMDHIIFVLGLFLLSLKLSVLLWQVTAFTLAHSITLIAGASGVIPISPEIIEPLIALSIVFIALENVFSSNLKAHRTAVVFGFGLLHGLGFASVLTEFGLPTGQFIAALIGFNVGVELAQIFVILCAFVLVGLPFGRKAYYRSAITIPASLVIAGIGVWWFVERIDII